MARQVAQLSSETFEVSPSLSAGSLAASSPMQLRMLFLSGPGYCLPVPLLGQPNWPDLLTLISMLNAVGSSDWGRALSELSDALTPSKAHKR